MRLEETSPGPNPLLKLGHLKPVPQDHVLTTFKHLQGGRLHQLPGQPAPAVTHSRSEQQIGNRRDEQCFLVPPFTAVVNSWEST